jgi:hypothetical protein
VQGSVNADRTDAQAIRGAPEAARLDEDKQDLELSEGDLLFNACRHHDPSIAPLAAA